MAQDVRGVAMEFQDLAFDDEPANADVDEDILGWLLLNATDDERTPISSPMMQGFSPSLGLGGSPHMAHMAAANRAPPMAQQAASAAARHMAARTSSFGHVPGLSVPGGGAGGVTGAGTAGVTAAPGFAIPAARPPEFASGVGTASAPGLPATASVAAAGGPGTSGGGGGGGAGAIASTGVGAGAGGGRKRKRTHNDLENRLAKLQEENRELEQHLESVTESDESIRRKKQDMKQQMAAMLASPANCGEGEIAALLARFSECYEHWGVQRRREIHFHLSQLERLMRPTNSTKMCLWTIAHDEAHQTPPSGGGGSHGSFGAGFGGAGTNSPGMLASPSLLSILTAELDLTEAQRAKLKNHRDNTRVLIDDLNRTLHLMQRLKSSVATSQATFADRIRRVQSSLSVQQIARFVLWVEHHKAEIETQLTL